MIDDTCTPLRTCVPSKTTPLLATSSSSPSTLPTCTNTVNNSKQQNNSRTSSTLCFQTHIANAHTTGVWTWEHSHDPQWKHLFYNYLHDQALTSAPLTLDEAKTLDSHLTLEMPAEGFFPPPHIAVKNLALLRQRVRPRPPLPRHRWTTSTLCVPHESYALAHAHIDNGTFLGYYMGWVVTPQQPGLSAYTFRLVNKTGYCDISGWDAEISHSSRARIFPMSFVNENIWDEEDASPNNNTLRSTTYGRIYSRREIRGGSELTLGHGLYSYDWSYYQRTLLQQALVRVQLICELQNHEEFVASTTTLIATLESLTHTQYRNLGNLTGSLHTLFCLVNGDSNPVLCGTILTHDMSYSAYLHQLGGVEEFVHASVFRHAHHPDRRDPGFFSWPTIITKARDNFRDKHYPADPVRRSSRLKAHDLRSSFFALSLPDSDNLAPSFCIPALLNVRAVPALTDSLTSWDVYKHMPQHSPASIHVINAEHARDLGLTPLAYSLTVTVVLHDGSIHHPTHFVLLGDLLGEAAIIHIPYAILTWKAVCTSDASIHYNDHTTHIYSPAGELLRSLPSRSEHHTPIDLADLSAITFPRPLTPVTATQLRSFPLLCPTLAPARRCLPSAPSPGPAPRHDLSSDSISHGEVDSCASDDDSVDDLPEIDMITAFTTPTATHSLSHLRVAWCNIHGCDDISKIERVMELMRAHRLDFLCLIDTQITSAIWGNAIRAAAIQRLGVGSTVDVHLTCLGGPNDTARVGGQILIKGPRIQSHTSAFSDPSGCAVVVGVDFHIGNTDVRLLSTYWPGSTGSDAHDTNSLWDKLQKYLHKTNQHMTPLDYIQSYTSTAMSTFTAVSNSVCILGGDFNAPRDSISPLGGIHEPLDTWGTLNNLTHVFTHLHIPVTPTYYSGTQPKSEIDHAFCTLSPLCKPTHGFVLDDDAWAQETDHRPVAVDFLLPGYSQAHLPRWKRRRRRAQIIDISRTNTREVTLFQNGMLKRSGRLRSPSTMTPIELHRKLERIHSDTYAVAKNICASPRRKTGNWTPQMVALRCRQGALLSIARITRDMAARPAVLRTRIRQSCKRWKDTLAGLSQTASEAREWGNYLGKGPEFWEALPPWEAYANVNSAIRRTRQSLQGRKSTESRHRFTARVTKRKELRANGKHLSELKTLLGGQQAGSMLDVLEEGGRRIIDPLEIAQHANAFFCDWHKAKPIQYGFHRPDADISKLLTDRAHFHREHSATGIPTPLLDKIWDALSSPAVTLRTHSSISTDFHTLIDTPPSLAEFRTALHHSKRQSSAGMSGVTYNLMSLWPTSTIQEVYDILCAIWTHKSTPPFWKWRWLVPIPKKADTNTLINLRPISLIEASRKLWIGLLIDKIKRFWSRTNILCPSQHAYLADKSTEGALLQFRNIMEETEECKTDHYLSSWDIKRAFDRVPKNILTLSWARLGVPQHIAEYMVGLDTHGTTVIRNPYTERRFRLKGYSAFTPRRKGHSPSFTAEVGTGQGDVTSPLNWIAFFDILLCALDTTDPDKPLIRAKGRILPTRDTGYADDLVSVMTTLSGLQRKADIVSAFAIVFGLDIAITKLRACKVEWGQENPDNPTCDTLKVHSYGWTDEDAQLVSLSTQKTSSTREALKYLGVLFDFSNDDFSSHLHLSTMLREKLHTLYSRGCDKQLKIEAIIYSLYPKARYPAKLAGWRLVDYHQIDKLFSVAFRRILQLPRSFPQALLYTPRTHGGIGLPLFSTQAHGDKIAMMHRGLLGDPSTNAAMEGLLERGARASNGALSTHKLTMQPINAKIQPDSDFRSGCTVQSLWVRSLLEWLHTGDLALHRHGSSSVGAPSEPIHEYLARHKLRDISVNGARHLAESGLSTVCDLLCENITTGTFSWNMDILRDTPMLRTLLQTPPPQFPSTPLLPGQCWASSHPDFSAHEGYVWEYIGKTGSTSDMANVRLWKSSTTLAQGAHMRLISPSCAGGTRHNTSFTALLSGPAQRIILSGDIADKKGVRRIILSARQHRLPDIFIAQQAAHPLLRSLIGDNLHELRHSDMFTDGSCTQHTSLLAHILGQASSATSGALVLTNRDTSIPYGTIVHATLGTAAGVRTAYGMELLMATVASTLRGILQESPGPPIRIYSDSKSTVHAAHSCSSRRTRKLVHKRMGFLIQQLHRTRHDNMCTFTHCYSHPERRKKRDAYTHVDHGNSTADAASASNQQDLLFPGFNRHMLPTTALLTDLLQPGQWYVGDSSGVPRLESSGHAIHAALHTTYLRTRDAYREADDSKPRAPFWTTATCAMAARQFETKGHRTYAQQTRVTKMIYDHYYHGENRIKGISDTTTRVERGACHLCSRPDSEEHYVLECCGPEGTDTLEPIRTKVAHDITTYIHTLKPGPGKTFAERYRDLALRPLPLTPQPQRVWKGLLSPTQLLQLCSSPGINQATPTSASIVKTIKTIQAILAQGFTDLRNQITALTYPHKYTLSHPETPPTTIQQLIIHQRSTQPSILAHFAPVDTAHTSIRPDSPRRFQLLTMHGPTRPLRHTYACGSHSAAQTGHIPQYVPHQATNPILQLRPSSLTSAPPRINELLHSAPPPARRTGLSNNNKLQDTHVNAPLPSAPHTATSLPKRVRFTTSPPGPHCFNSNRAGGVTAYFAKTSRTLPYTAGHTQTPLDYGSNTGPVPPSAQDGQLDGD
jgi:hypothetical protein